MIFPAMDLMDSGCVRLLKGDFDARTNYDASPIEVAQSYAAAGARWMHIVDLDGAKNGKAEQSDLILKIANSANIKVQTGGGLRDLAQFRPATKGWTEPSQKTLWDVIDDYLGSGLKTLLVTDIGRDGMQTGGNVALYKRIQSEFPTLDLITSGGVGTLDHVADLKAIDPYGIIIGKALYEGAFTLDDAISC